MEFEKKYKALATTTLILIIIFTAFFSYRASKLEFNYDFEDFFPQNDPDATYYKEYRKIYGSENDFLLLVIERERMFDPAFLSKVDAMGKALKQLKHVNRVLSPTEAKQLVMSSFSAMEIPLLHYDDPKALKDDSVNIYGSQEWKGTFFGYNGKSLLFLIEHEHTIKGADTRVLLDQIETLKQKYGFERSYLMGRVISEHVFISKMSQELALFMSLSALLLILFLWLAYKSTWGVLVPLSAVLISILWTCGLMELTGYKIDILTVLLPSILFIITISDITHFLSKYLEDLRAGADKLHAFQTAYKEVGIATFITAITTAVGFVTFVNAQMQPIKYFGLYAAAGVFVSYVVAFTYMPAIIVLLPKPKIAAQNNNEHFWYLKLHRLLRWVFQHHKGIIWGSVVVCGISVVGILKMEINNTIIDDISDRDQLKKSLRYIEDNFGGVRAFELDIKIAPQDGNIFYVNALQKAHKVQQYLEQHYQINNIISPSTMVSLLNKAQNGAQNSAYGVPQDTSLLQSQLSLLRKQQNRKELRAYIKDKGQRFRISGRVKDFGSKPFAQKELAFTAFMDSLNKTPGPVFDYHLTGTASLIDKNNLRIANDMILDLIIGVLTIGVIIGFLFRSVKMAILAIIPNFAPLLLIAGIMGAFGMNLKASNSIIFSIAFGIAIDDSIHFLSRLKEEMEKGKPLFYAIKTTYLSTGKAMLITSLIVISGFCTMVFSDFAGTFYMGLLVSLTLIFAIAFDFLLMPALLINFFRKKK